MLHPWGFKESDLTWWLNNENITEISKLAMQLPRGSDFRVKIIAQRVHALWHPALCGPMNYKHTMFLCPWNYPSKNIGMSCCFLFQGIFSIQGSNLCLLSWQEDSLPLNHLGLKDSAQFSRSINRALKTHFPTWN